jgi:magnesium-transporting ATPase (P-type)
MMGAWDYHMENESDKTISNYDSTSLTNPPKPRISENDEKLFMLGFSGFILLIAGILVLCIGVYQILIRWKLNVDLSRYEGYTVVLLTLVFTIIIIVVIRKSIENKGSIYQILGAGSLMIVMLIFLIAFSAPYYFNLYNVAMANLIIGILITISGVYCYQKSNGVFRKLIKESSNKEVAIQKNEEQKPGVVK